MQHIQRLDSLGRQSQPFTPLRLTTVRPSTWERLRARLEKTFTADVIFGTVTVLLASGLFISFARALAHYTIIPLP